MYVREAVFRALNVIERMLGLSDLKGIYCSHQFLFPRC